MTLIYESFVIYFTIERKIGFERFDIEERKKERQVEVRRRVNYIKAL